MKLATNIKKATDFGFQLILNESGLVIGINLLCEKRILVKHRFSDAIEIGSVREENKLVNKLLANYLLKEPIKTSGYENQNIQPGYGAKFRKI